MTPQAKNLLAAIVVALMLIAAYLIYPILFVTLTAILMALLVMWSFQVETKLNGGRQ